MALGMKEGSIVTPGLRESKKVPLPLSFTDRIDSIVTDRNVPMLGSLKEPRMEGKPKRDRESLFARKATEKGDPFILRPPLPPLSKCRATRRACRRHRLDEVMIEARLTRTPAVLILPVAGNRHQQRRGKLRLPPQLPGHLVAAHARQADVQKHHVGMIALGQFQAAGAV